MMQYFIVVAQQWFMVISGWRLMWHLFVIFNIYIRGSLNKFPDIFCMGTFIDSTHMKL